MAAGQQSPGIDFSWINVDTEWGVRVEPDAKHGLTLDRINVGSYGETPSLSHARNANMRGAAALREASPS